MTIALWQTITLTLAAACAAGYVVIHVAALEIKDLQKQIKHLRRTLGDETQGDK